MASKTLTMAGIKSFRPDTKRREIRDGGAALLYVIVQPSGHKSFAMRFRSPDGRPTKLVLGPVDFSGEAEGEPVIGQPLTLAGARRLAADVGRQRAMGKDVVAETKVAKQRRKFEVLSNAQNTFHQATRDFVDGYAKKKIRRWTGTARLLGLTPEGEAVRGGLAERWADRNIATIDGHDVHAVIDEARDHGIPGIAARNGEPSENRARHLFAALSKMFSWLHRHRRVATNPCASVHQPEPSQKRERNLTSAEIAKFWKAASVEPTFGPLLKLLLLTGCRLNEIAGIRRSELSDDGSTLTLPGSRTKNKRVHVVPFAPSASELIASVPDVLASDLIFTTTGTSPVSGWASVKRRLDARMNIPPWRLHDLRRTAVTQMAELGILPHIIEAVVNHVSGHKGGVAGVYNKAVYAAEKRAALERWASHVEGLVSGEPSGVVALRGRKRS